jgi:hypothetical protein
VKSRVRKEIAELIVKKEKAPEPPGLFNFRTAVAELGD